MEKFFRIIKDNQFLHQAEELIRLFEKKLNITLPNDYRKFLLDLEMYISYTKAKKNIVNNEPNEFLLEHVDNIFRDYYFTLPDISGEFNITDIANLSLGYSLLEDMQEENQYTDFILTGNICHSENYHYFLALNPEGEVYLLPNKSANNELKLTKTNDTKLLHVCKSFRIFLEDIL